MGRYILKHPVTDRQTTGHRHNEISIQIIRKPVLTIQLNFVKKTINSRLFRYYREIAQHLWVIKRYHAP